MSGERSCIDNVFPSEGFQEGVERVLKGRGTARGESSSMLSVRVAMLFLYQHSPR